MSDTPKSLYAELSQMFQDCGGTLSWNGPSSQILEEKLKAKMEYFGDDYLYELRIGDVVEACHEAMQEYNASCKGGAL